MPDKKLLEDYQNHLNALANDYLQLKSDKQAQFQELVVQYRSNLEMILEVYKALPVPKPNIWTVPRIFNKTHNENFISDYLAYILDPKKNGIGNQPLMKFLELIAPEIELWEFQKVKIIREYPLQERRIDILILIDEHVVIGLENKIFAFENDNQTTFYAQVLDQLYQERTRLYTFLTIGGVAAQSDKFRALSYQQLLDGLRTIQFPDDIFREKALWEDFLIHVEVFLTMNSKKLDIPEPEKLALYLKHHKMLTDLSSAYENSREAVFSFIAQNIQNHFGNWDWNFDFNPVRPWQLLYKPHWNLNQPPIRVIWVLWFSREILLADEFQISIEIQGYNQKWDTEEEILRFFTLFNPRFEEWKNKYKENGMFYLTAIPERPVLAKLGVAWKKYPMIINLDQVETVLTPIIQAIREFEFLIDPIEETLEEIRGK